MITDFSSSQTVLDSDAPGLVVGEEDPAAVSVALAAALESAVEADVGSGSVEEVEEVLVGEETPLLGSVKGVKTGDGRRSGGLVWFVWEERPRIRFNVLEYGTLDGPYRFSSI